MLHVVLTRPIQWLHQLVMGWQVQDDFTHTSRTLILTLSLGTLVHFQMAALHGLSLTGFPGLLGFLNQGEEQKQNMSGLLRPRP